ncbi:hypothetical protein GQ457_06G013090 [Hibiscus cannabinus]
MPPRSTSNTDKFYARNDQPGRIKSQQYSRTKQGCRNKVKVKDLKPKRIKDYLECKISQRKRRIERKKPSFITSRYVLNLPPGED